MKLTRTLALLAAFALAACGKENEQTGSQAEKPAAGKQAKAQPGQEKEAAHGHGQGGIELSPEEEKAAGIKTEKLDWSPAGGEIAVTGTIEPNLDRLAQVAPRVPGRVEIGRAHV